MNSLKILLILAFVFLSSNCSKKVEIDESQRKLQQAVFNGTIIDIKKCLNNGASLNEPIGCNNYLPLEGAIFLKDLDKFKYMLNNGAKPNKRCIEYAKSQKDQTFILLFEEKKLTKALQ